MIIANMNYLSRICIYFILLIALCNSSYTQAYTNTNQKRGVLIESSFVKRISVNEINGLFPEKSKLDQDITHIPKYDIDLYRLVYRSIHNGKLENLSGLVVVPVRIAAAPHMQYHHGTMFPFPHPNGEGSLDAPSFYKGLLPKEADAQYETRLFGNYLGSYGYLVSLPDYAGYAESAHLEHPYSVNPRLAEQSVDMILATREFCEQKNIKLNKKLFLSGWSEGGAACVAVQKLIEKEYKSKIEVTANAPLAGFYNTIPYLKPFLNFGPFIGKDYGEDLDVMIWTLYTVNSFSPEPVSFDKVFKFEVKNQLDVLKNRPSSRPKKIMKWLWFKNKKRIVQMFRESCLHEGWSPKAPIYVHHGTDDDIVFYDKNVEVMVNNLNKEGGKVVLRKYDGHDHYSLALLYFLSMIEDFSKF